MEGAPFIFILSALSWRKRQLRGSGAVASAQEEPWRHRAAWLNFSESLGSAVFVGTTNEQTKLEGYVNWRGELCHAVMSWGWKTSSCFSQQTHSRFLVASWLLVFGLTLALGQAGGHRWPPWDRLTAGTPPWAAPGSRFASTLESSPGHMRWQRAGVISETPVGLSSVRLYVYKAQRQSS